MKQDKIAKRREEILEAALDVFAEKGYHATKIADIAERLGIGHGTFYRYFKNKLDIFSSVADGIIAKVGQMVAQEQPDESHDVDSYRQQLYRIGQSLYDIFMEDVRMFKLVYYEILGVDPLLNKKLDDAMDLFDLYTEEYLKNGVNKGFLRPDLDTDILAKAINGMLFTASRSVIEAESSQKAFDRWVDSVTLLMLDGMVNRDAGG